MTQGIGAEVLDLLVRFTMSKETAERVKTQFADMSARNEPVSYLDCVLLDAALDVLGIEQQYYGLSDDEWRETVKQRKAQETRYKAVLVVDVTDTWSHVAE